MSLFPALQFDEELLQLQRQEEADHQLAMIMAAKYHQMSDSDADSSPSRLCPAPAPHAQASLHAVSDSDSDMTVDLGRQSPTLISDTDSDHDASCRSSSDHLLKKSSTALSAHQLSDTDSGSDICRDMPQKHVSITKLKCQHNEKQKSLKSNHEHKIEAANITKHSGSQDDSSDESDITVDLEMESPSGDTQSTKPRCQYGHRCYRKNPSHLAEFWHPGSMRCL